MTDAERIAELLGIPDARLVPTVRWDGGVKIPALLAMLAVVRREERQACATEVQKEIDAAKARMAPHKPDHRFYYGAEAQVQALGWALKHIQERGEK